MARAWLEWNGTIYWCTYTRQPFEPRTAVTCLVEGIWKSHPGLAHFILRSRIFIDYEPTALCRGAVIVCAKRITRLAQAPEDAVSRMKAADRAVQVGKEHSNRLSPSLTPSSESAALYQRDRSIEAWLIDSKGRLLGCASNSSGRNRLQHAEMNLLQAWWQRERRPLPVDARLVTTLEPCPMCAGAIWECLEHRERFRVQFVEPDLGTAVRRSVLRGTKLLEHCKNIEHL
ncbi:MAG: hypothetical protein FJY29_10075 [Betaproteobacteria bacterium]|nr:hypothetical protein [Betaproteobacteria bacterium]